MGEKLAEDVYTLLQYHNGDKTMDVTNMFTEKSRKRINRTRRETIVNTNSNDADTNDMTLREFCSTLLTEMRLERDCIRNGMESLTEHMNQMKKLNEDIVRMKKEHCETQDRVTRLEVLVHEQRRTDKRVDKQHERISDLKQLIDTSLSIGHECRQRIGEMNQLTTNRINSVELLMRQNKPQIVQHVQGENTNIIPNTDAHVDPTRQQKVHSVPVPTSARPVPIPDVTIVNDDNTRHVKMVPTKRDTKKNTPLPHGNRADT